MVNKAINHTHPFVQELIDILGLKDRPINSLNIHIAIDEVMTVEVIEVIESPQEDGPYFSRHNFKLIDIDNG